MFSTLKRIRKQVMSGRGMRRVLEPAIQGSSLRQRYRKSTFSPSSLHTIKGKQRFQKYLLRRMLSNRARFLCRRTAHLWKEGDA